MKLFVLLLIYPQFNINLPHNKRTFKDNFKNNIKDTGKDNIKIDFKVNF